MVATGDAEQSFANQLRRVVIDDPFLSRGVAVQTADAGLLQNPLLDRREFLDKIKSVYASLRINWPQIYTDRIGFQSV